MTAFNFPASPTVGQTYTAGGVTYIWDGTSWAGQTSPLPMATAAQWLADTPGLVLVTDPVWSAASPVTLTDAATITVDMSTFINGDLLLTSAVGATRVLGNPTNAKAGQNGVIKCVQPSSGGPCALSFASDYKFISGVPITLSTSPNAVDFVSYYVDSASLVWLVIGKAVQ